ncbi:MAG: xanthine dehydrogenase family protein molybdopterin-binding subunit [Hyphomicrobiaceae bacterium]
MSAEPVEKPWIGRSVERHEDAALLTGTARFMDDLGVAPGTLHATFVRAPHAHAKVSSIDTTAAVACDGVQAVITGVDIAAFCRPFTVGVKAPMEHRPVAVGRVRYQGEPVAVVLGDTPYTSEDGAALVEVAYDPLPAVVDPRAAMAEDAPLLHPEVGANVVADRSYRYGNPEAAFADAAHVISIDITYPRNSVTPIECNGLIAEYHSGTDSYEVTSNFQGPFALHPVMALALQVPANRLRLKSPPASGGSFGTKQSVFPYIVACCVASRIVGRPVKWIEDRLEHLMAGTSATNRVTALTAAVEADGRITALDWDQIDDCGAYLRAPEPATIYRMHGNMTGAYDIRHVAIRNRNVLTNKTPSGLVRGFGGPQVYFALERLVHKIACQLALEPLEVIKKNLIAAGAFPYRTASGGLYDSGDYPAAVALAEADGRLQRLQKRRQDVRAAGGLYGIGMAAIVEPSISNMGYITTVLTADERARAGPKGGAVATATVGVDALGSVSAHISSVPQGQGHETVIAQVVADGLGLTPDAIAVNTDLDTGRDAWSVASGNYSSRFSGAVTGAAKLATDRLRGCLSDIAAAHFGCSADAISFAGGTIAVEGSDAKPLPFRRLAATSHWAQATLPQGMEPVIRETVFWSPDVLMPPNDADEINSSAAHGFVFDMCGVEIDRDTGQVRIDDYTTVHDAGTLLHPAMADGQVRGGFANALGATLYEHFSYGADGSFHSGTFADYTVPTATEVPDITILHLETASPVTPLGAKGIGEGNCMSTPVCIANAVADALGQEDISLPLTPSRVHALLATDEPAMPVGAAGMDLPKLHRADYAVTGDGEARVGVPPDVIWPLFFDVAAVRAIVPGCRTLVQVDPGHFSGQAVLGVGVVKGVFDADVRITDAVAPRSLRLVGDAKGPLGASTGEAVVELIADGDGTCLRYRYGVDLSGKAAAIGGRMIGGAAKVLINEFFRRLAARVDPAAHNGVTEATGLMGMLRQVWERVRLLLAGGHS